MIKSLLKRPLNKRQWNGVFVILLIAMAWFCGTFKTMHRGPYSIHQWRQADCLSVTENYRSDHLPFLEPQVHRQNQEKAGKTISEFPIVYYGMAKLWSWFGKHYWMYRFLGFLIFSVGLFYLKKTADRVLNDGYWSSFVALFLFTSPILVYYSNNFLMNTYALGLALIGVYHFHRYHSENRYRNLIFACILFLFAGLLKITALLVFLAIGGVYVFQLLSKKRPWKTIVKESLPYAAVLFLILLWQMYVHSYNSANMANIFLQGTLPIWDLPAEKLALIRHNLWNEILPQVFNIPTILATGALFVFLLVQFKKTTLSYLKVSIFVVLGMMAYFMLFFAVFDVHDYYLINLTIIVPIVLLIFLDFLKNNHAALFQSKILKSVAAIVLVSGVYYAAVHTRIKYDAGDGWVKSSSLLSKEKKGYWEYYHWWYGLTFTDLETIDPYLTSIGCDPSKKVVSIPDQSINISLYLMNRKGYTDYGENAFVEGERIEKAKEWGAEYLIVNDKRMLELDYMQPFITNKVGETEHVAIFRL